MYVSLFGWQSAREIIDYEGYLFFQVALHGHCEICQRRIDHIKSVVSRKGLQVKYGHLLDRFPRDVSYMWVGIEKPTNFMEEREKKDFIKSTFDLPIE